MQKKGLDKGFNLVHVSVSVSACDDKFSLEETSIQWDLLFTMGMVQNICHFWCIRRQYSLEETSIQWNILFTMGMVQNICHFFAILYFFLVHVKSF